MLASFPKKIIHRRSPYDPLRRPICRKHCAAPRRSRIRQQPTARKLHAESNCLRNPCQPRAPGGAEPSCKTCSSAENQTTEDAAKHDGPAEATSTGDQRCGGPSSSAEPKCQPALRLVLSR